MKKSNLRRFVQIFSVVMLTVAVSGCVVDDGRGGGHGWCWWHPNRCR